MHTEVREPRERIQCIYVPKVDVPEPHCLGLRHRLERIERSFLKAKPGMAEYASEGHPPNLLEAIGQLRGFKTEARSMWHVRPQEETTVARDRHVCPTLWR